MIAVLSDIHGNLEALNSVLEDCAKRGVEEIYSLGDIIGYGPNPRECLQASSSFEISIKGNHEEALQFFAEDFNEKARQAIHWTKEQLTSRQFPREENYRLWDLIENMKEMGGVKDMVLVHGTVRQPTREYLLARDVRDRAKMNEIFARLDKPLCFCGHSHMPGVFFEDFRYAKPEKDQNSVSLDGRKIIVNVGSVGQPRDADPRACYVTVEENRILFHRIAYDVHKTMSKIVQEPALPDFLAYRLEKGR